MPSTRESGRPQDAACGGTLYVVATPIGNLSDITLRALEILRSATVIAAEDTRHTRKLLAHFEIHTPLLSYHSHSHDQRSFKIIDRLSDGQSVALVTDAGTPGISDPGSLLISQVIEAGLPVTSIPGPVALISALALSGLPTHTFTFAGFPPPKGQGRRRFFSSLKALPMTLVLYESPQRVARTLREILESWGERRVAIARELTKKFEEVFRGTLSEAIEKFSGATRGEITMVISGASETEDGEEAKDWRTELRTCLNDPSVSVKDISEAISHNFGISKKDVYREALDIRGESRHNELEQEEG